MAFKINGILVSGLGTNGAGVPTGGTSTQILQKNSNVDFDTSWVDAPIIPTKTSEIENDSDFATNASVDEKLQSHRNNTEVHITAEERELWNGANAYTDTAIANLVGSAPDTLNTLEEISKALNEDAEYVINLASKIDTKQDTLTGELNQVVSFDADGKVISKTLIASDVGAVDADYVTGEISAVQVEIDGLSETKANAENPVLSGTLNLNGEAWFAGDVYVGSTSGTHKDEGSKKLASEDYVKSLVKSLNSNLELSFYCVEDVTIITNGVSVTYPANSNVEVKFLDTDIFEIVPTSNYSIMALNAFPGALGTYYPWLEGVKQFSNILFDMNNEDFYSKWSQGNQGAYQVQFAQYLNCIFWSDNPYVRDVNKRTNYTLYYTSQLPLCYSSIPDNTFKAFFLAFGVNADPNWGNKAYRDSFAKATWATQAFSYYGARTIGIFGHDDPDFNITLPKDCRGLMYASTAVENAGTFDAINVTDFGASSGSWRDAFGHCSSLRNLYIKNLKVNLNVSWSPLNYDSIYYIISSAANTNAITISVSPYTYNLLNPSDFELAASKNITIALLTANYAEDKRLSEIANKADKTDVLLKAEQTLTDTELTQVRKNLKFIGKDVEGQQFTINGETVTASKNAEIFGDYDTNIAVGQWSIAEGSGTIAKGRASHAEGAYTIASGKAQHVEGIANIEDAEDKYIHITGNGTSPTDRSNAYTLDWNGNGWFAGNLYVGGTSQEDGSKIATEAFVSNSLSSIQSQIDTINASLAAAVEELSKI